MTALCVRGRAGRVALHWLWAALLLGTVAANAAADEPIVVSIDQASIMKLPERAATVVVGNPLIADLAIQPGGIAVVTGKGYGETNFIVMDHSGAVLLEKIVEVREPSDPIVVVYRGYTRQTYSCTPECSPRITLGDTSKDDVDKETNLPNDYFNRTLSQTVTRDNQAMGAGAGGK
jgi:putative type II/III system pilus formation protein